MATFCEAADLGYQTTRTVFADSQPFILDASYRLAHLPLVAPHHRDVIPRKAGTDYQMGRHGRVYSLVLPIDADALEASPAWRAFNAELRDMPFAGKIAWDLPPKRRERLHATICGSLGRDVPPALAHDVFADMAPFEAELRGLFSGNINLGRLYVPVFPEMLQGQNAIHMIQRAMGRPVTSMYLVGMHNLTDHLTISETAALAALLARWQDRLLVRLTISELWLMGSFDDLVLDATVDARLKLNGRQAGVPA
jgi:hypothetical protein